MKRARSSSGSRVGCKECGRPVLFRSKGRRGRHGMHADRAHDLCSRCWRRACAEAEQRAAELPPFAP